jgi:AcrR family transcriptional regulator
MSVKPADEVGVTDTTDQRRDQMLAAAAELIAQRGFSETRIADVARRVGASPALVIYYFGTKDRLLTAALRFSEDSFYAECADMLSRTPGLRDRLETLVRLTCVPPDDDEFGAWGLWFDLWAQAFRHPDVARDRVELEKRWRTTIAGVVRDGVTAKEIRKVDADDFAITWAVLLDGLSIQVALKDELVNPERAFAIAMGFAEHALGLPAPPRRGATRPDSR